MDALNLVHVAASFWAGGGGGGATIDDDRAAADPIHALISLHESASFSEDAAILDAETVRTQESFVYYACFAI